MPLHAPAPLALRSAQEFAQEATERADRTGAAPVDRIAAIFDQIHPQAWEILPESLSVAAAAMEAFRGKRGGAPWIEVIQARNAIAQALRIVEIPVRERSEPAEEGAEGKTSFWYLLNEHFPACCRMAAWDAAANLDVGTLCDWNREGSSLVLGGMRGDRPVSVAAVELQHRLGKQYLIREIAAEKRDAARHVRELLDRWIQLHPFLTHIAIGVAETRGWLRDALRENQFDELGRVPGQYRMDCLILDAIHMGYGPRPQRERAVWRPIVERDD